MPQTDIENSLRSRLNGVRNLLPTAGPKIDPEDPGSPGQGVDAVLITDMVNVGYLTGFTGSAGYALVGKDTAVLITDSRYTLRARAESPHFDVVIASGSGGYLETLQEQLAAVPKVKRVGFEASKLTVSQFQHFTRKIDSVEWVPTESVVERLRAVKDGGEVAAIKRAIDVAEAAYVSVKGLLKPGLSERDFAIELEFAMRRGGAEAIAFETIVASGPNSAHPHHRPSERVLEPGDWVTIDWGATVDGYCSDMTRTVLIAPTTPTAEQKRVYDVVLTAQRKAIAAIAPGKNGQEIDAIARDHIAAAGYGDYFGHSLGHALGRVVHDGPGLSTRAADVILTPGMVLTVEPGVYIENWGGIRIEEDIVVTASGCDILTHLPNDLEIVG